MSTTARRIRETAIELFATQGFAATGIRELADRVGVTTSTLYHHYSGKDELLDAIVQTSMKALNDVADYWDDPALWAVDEGLAGLIASHVVIHATYPHEAVVVDRQLQFLRPDSRRRAVAARDRYEQAWRTKISEGVADGWFSAEDPTVAARALLGATTAVADWYRPEGTIESTKLADAFVTMSFDLLNATHRPTTPALDEPLELFNTRWEEI